MDSDMYKDYSSSIQQFTPPDILQASNLNVCLGRQAMRLYKQGKHLFSMFATHEDPYDGPLSALYMASAQRPDGAPEMLVHGTTLAHVGYYTGFGGDPTDRYGLAHMQTRVMDGRGLLRGSQPLGCLPQIDQPVPLGGQTLPYRTYPDPRPPIRINGEFLGPITGGATRSHMVLPLCAAPNLLVLPLETIATVYNHRDDAFAVRGLDLRAIASMEFSGEIMGTDSGQAGNGFPAVLGNWYGSQVTVNDGSAFNGRTDTAISDYVQAQAWTIRIMSAYDQEHVLLPGRTDTDAQFSLIPTGASAIPSGGAPAF